MIYFDNAATSLRKPDCVVQAMTDALCTLGNSGRSIHSGAMEASRTIFQARQALAELEGSETEASRMLEEITGRATVLKTEEAALEAEASTARTHMEDLNSLHAAMEGDREKKTALMEAIRQENSRLGEEIARLRGEAQA